MPILGQQPPLHGNAAVRIVTPKEEGNDRAIVPVQPYFEEIPDETAYTNMQMVQDPSYAPEMEASYQMDHNTLMFIAYNGMGRPPPPQNQRIFKPAVPGPCYQCGGDHWYRDCPEQVGKPTGIPPIKRFCVDCGIKHLIQDCPANPEGKGKATLNYMEVIPSSSRSSSKSELTVPVKVVTQAQAKAKEGMQVEGSIGKEPLS